MAINNLTWLGCAPETMERQLYIYIVMGIAIIVSNSMILLAITCAPDLRHHKEYVVIAGLAMADKLAGWVTLTNAMNSWKQIRNCDHLQSTAAMVPRASCVGQPRVILTAFALFAQGVMLLTVTADRLFVTAAPDRYFKLTAGRYALNLVVVSFGSAALFVAVGVVRASADTTPVPARCPPTESFQSDYYTVFFLTRVACGLLSVIVYAFVLALFQWRVSPWRRTPEMWQLRSRQRRLIVTVGVCSLTTLLFDTTPNLLMLAAKAMESAELTTLVLYLWPIYCLNAICNVFIYSVGQKEIRMELLIVMFCWIPVMIQIAGGENFFTRHEPPNDNEGADEKEEGADKEDIGTPLSENRNKEEEVLENVSL